MLRFASYQNQRDRSPVVTLFLHRFSWKMGRAHINILYKSRSLTDKACRWKMPLSNLANLEDLWSLSRHPTEPPLWSDLLNFQFMLAKWYNNPKRWRFGSDDFPFPNWVIFFSSREFFSECIAPSKPCTLVIWDGSESQEVCIIFVVFRHGLVLKATLDLYTLAYVYPYVLTSFWIFLRFIYIFLCRSIHMYLGSISTFHLT